MKKSSLIINVVLAVAIAGLYILHFIGKPTITTDNNGLTSSSSMAITGEGFALAWVNMDSVMGNYDMYFDIQKDLEAKGRKIESDMNVKARDLEKQAVDLQDKFQKTLITRSQAQAKQQELAEKEQELYRVWEEMRRQFADEQQVMLRRIQQSIYDYLKEYNKDKGYHLIISSSFGGPLLFGNPGLEITDEVLKGLNKNYIDSKSPKSK
jgi:outer membrane protein